MGQPELQQQVHLVERSKIWREASVHTQDPAVYEGLQHGMVSAAGHTAACGIGLHE